MLVLVLEAAVCFEVVESPWVTLIEKGIWAQMISDSCRQSWIKALVEMNLEKQLPLAISNKICYLLRQDEFFVLVRKESVLMGILDG